MEGPAVALPVSHECPCHTAYSTDGEEGGKPVASEAQTKQLGESLADATVPLAKKMRNIFTLRGIGGAAAVRALDQGLTRTDSELLRHESAYLLGQMQDMSALPILERILRDPEDAPIVRHEAAEAIGALGVPSLESLLREFRSDPCPEVRETCELALDRLAWLGSMGSADTQAEGASAYLTVDPAPPFSGEEWTVPKLRALIMDPAKPLFERYSAMFGLRDEGSDESVAVLSEALRGMNSALARHEVAFVLGQVQSPIAVEALCACLRDSSELGMVRHEAAEALGSIADEDTVEVLKAHTKDADQVVADSCVVALDMLAYNNSEDFQWADGVATAVDTEEAAVPVVVGAVSKEAC